MRIFVIGTGGREHALAWKMLQSPRMTHLFSNATNGSLLSLTKTYPHKTISFVDIADMNLSGLTQFSIDNQIDLVVIGNESLLAAGLSDKLQQNGIKVFGCSQAAAAIETSKAFAKDFMIRHGIPTAQHATFQDFAAAKHHVDTIDYPIVIKASGLAAGKGVFLPQNNQEAHHILENLLVKKILGDEGASVVIEERLVGEEISLLAFTDGSAIAAMPCARDYKRLLDGDKGPNTGGMGAYAPVQLPAGWDTHLLAEQTIVPTIRGLAQEQRAFVGVLYAGLMLTANGVRVLEFNCRFGDPETQVLMPLLESDLVDVMEACVEKRLAQHTVKFRNEHAVCVVLASSGYPNANCHPRAGGDTGAVATQLNLKDLLDSRLCGNDNSDSKVTVFHAGTRITSENDIVSTGGRIIGITACASSLNTAIEYVYQSVKSIHFEGMHYRKDIAQQSSHDAYAQAGVNIDAGNKAVSLMAQAVRSTYGKEVLAGIGAFGGMFDAAALKDMKSPVLVASTDGIGTKVQLAAAFNQWESLGHDIVNHSVNDILVQGAKPLFFMDYVASSKLNPEKIAAIVTGMAEACRSVSCALLGGETAEMPGVYNDGMVDVAGTIIGVVEKADALPRKNIKAGDMLLGLASSGPHTNGYSLIRKIFPSPEKSLVDQLLKPHRCYLSPLQKALDNDQQPIKALVHITGGGFFENIPRILPENIRAQLAKWPVPDLFKTIQKQGSIPEEQMYRIFNMGVGMVIIAAPEHVAHLQSLIDEPLITVGRLVEGNNQVQFA